MTGAVPGRATGPPRRIERARTCAYDRRTAMSPGEPAAPLDRLAELRASAKGWHGIQLAALGFIGLCGVIQTGDAADPWALQVLSGILVLVAFALACAGIVLVGRAAWPLYGGASRAPAGDEDRAIEITSRQLTRGLLMTFLSVAALALATATSWWPQDDAAAGASEVRVQTDDGRTACGELAASSQPGAVRLVSDGRPVDVSLGAVTSLAPAGSC
jgi:hypothetical protein